MSRRPRPSFEPSLSSPAKARTSQAVAGWLLLVLVLPRLLRMLYPQVWVEDDFYLESAWFVSRGFRPYLDFVHPHMPLLEFAVAPWLWLFGASHHSIELLNEAAIYLTSVMVVPLGTRVGGRRAGICAALLYACSSLVFRYHVFERECFAGALILGAVLIELREHRSPHVSALQAALVIAACAVKLTAIIPSAIVLGYSALIRKRWRGAIAEAAGVAAGIGLLTVLFYEFYGFDFIFQAFLFHFMKGRDAAAHLALYPAAILDLLAPLFVLGCVAIAMRRQRTSEAWLVISLVTANYLFFGFFSPTAWAHNYLDWLPYVAVVAGVGLDRLAAAVIELVTGSETASRGREWRWALAGGGFVLISLCTITPLVNENWLRGSVYGFGFMPREELGELASAVAAGSRPRDNVIAPSFVCFEANRPQLVRFPETYGPFREARQTYEHEGFFAARAQLGGVDFFELIARTAHFWNDQIKRGLEDGTVVIVIPDSPLMLLPIVLPPLATIDRHFLIEHGYAGELMTDHFVVWKRNGSASGN